MRSLRTLTTIVWRAFGATFVCLAMLTPSANAQPSGQTPAEPIREVVIRGARIHAEDTSCWSNSLAPCDGADHATLELTAGRRRLAVRVVSVEVEVGAVWVVAVDTHILLRSEMVGTQPLRRSEPVATVRARTTDHLFIHYRNVADASRVRVTVEVDGQRATLTANHTVLSEHPDPDFSNP